MNRIRPIFLLSVIIFAAASAVAQWKENPETGSSQAKLEDRTNVAGMSGMGPELKVGFVNLSSTVTEKKAVVRADVWGVDLVQPESDGEPNNTRAFLAYVLDRGEPVTTADKEYTFTNLSPGWHTITVELRSTNNQPIGSPMTLKLHVPR